MLTSSEVRYVYFDNEKLKDSPMLNPGAATDFDPRDHRHQMSMGMPSGDGSVSGGWVPARQLSDAVQVEAIRAAVELVKLAWLDEGMGPDTAKLWNVAVKTLLGAMGGNEPTSDGQPNLTSVEAVEELLESRNHHTACGDKELVRKLALLIDYGGNQLQSLTTSIEQTAQEVKTWNERVDTAVCRLMQWDRMEDHVPESTFFTFIDSLLRQVHCEAFNAGVAHVESQQQAVVNVIADATKADLAGMAERFIIQIVNASGWPTGNAEYRKAKAVEALTEAYQAGKGVRMEGAEEPLEGAVTLTEELLVDLTMVKVLNCFPKTAYDVERELRPVIAEMVRRSKECL